MKRIFLILICCYCQSITQITQFPYFQNFDSAYVTPPLLPTGWRSSQNRVSGTNDFTTTTGTSYSMPNCVISTNAKVQQFLYSPVFDLSQKIADSIIFFERRSSTHDAGLLIEASVDGGINFNLKISDTLRNPGHANYVERKLKLPPILNNQPNVVFRWNVLGNGTGSTATIRFDNIIVKTETSIDIGIKSIYTSPQYPSIGDSIYVFIVIKNFGNQSIEHFEIDLFIDTNTDSIEQELELHQKFINEITFQSNDTLTYTFFIPWLGINPLPIIGKLNLIGDESIENNKKLYHVKYGVKKFSIVINEIMYRPNAPEPEWIEITNRTSDSINLINWKISDSKVTSRHNITNTNYFIKPKEYAIITKDTASFIEIRNNVNSKIFLISTLPALNNDSDAVVIYDDIGKTIDSVYYRSSWGGSSGGKSLERINIDSPSNLKSNWGSSIHPEGCTPGQINSLSQKDYDLKLLNVTFEPQHPVIGDNVKINSLIKNIGKNGIDNFLFSLYLYIDTATQNLVKIYESEINTILLPEDSIIISCEIVLDSIMEYIFKSEIINPIDQDTLNNFLNAKVITGYSKSTIVINEIMFAPVGGEPEWIELYNNSDHTVNLKEWKVSNRNSNSKYKIITTDYIILPDDFVVITKDSTLLKNYRDVNINLIESPSLPTYLFNNMSDAVALFDNRNIQMDSVFYFSSWGGTNGKSLERVEAKLNSLDSTNWGTSLDSTGATIGKQNYLTPLELDLKISSLSYDSLSSWQNVKIITTIKNAGKTAVNHFILKIYHDVNKDSIPQVSELIETKILNVTLKYKDTLRVEMIWNEPGSGSKNIIAYVEYSDDMRPKDNVRNMVIKIGYPEKCIVINEIMYSPLTDGCEYIEVFNRSQYPVEMAGWKIHDWAERSKINEFKLGNVNFFLYPNSYLVLAADSSIFKNFEYLKETSYNVFVFNKTSLSLNNEGDCIVLKDLKENCIDSVCYSPDWNNPEIYDVSGRALERINPEIESNDPRNWSTCVLSIGGTPGKTNSIYTATLPPAGELYFHPNPFSPDADGYEDFCIINYKLPASAGMMNLKIFDSKGRLIRTLANNEPTGPEGKLIWDGMNDDNRKVNMGIYIIILEAFDVNGRNVNRLKGVVVVGGRL